MRNRPKVASTPLFIPLESISVASPCNADWNAMHGDDRSRFCSGCAKNVYNLSALSKPEAEALLLEKEGKLCVRYFQRPDGTILTQDCPIGLLRADEKRLQPQFAFWANATALGMLVAALVTGALSPMALHAQPYENTAPVASSTPIPSCATPPAVASPTTAPSPTPTPTSTPALVPPVVMGDVAPISEVRGEVQANPTPTPEPPPLLMTLGMISVAPTPVPIAPKSTMGTIKLPAADSKPAPTPVPAPPVTMGEPVVMGRPAFKPIPTPPKPAPSKSVKKTKTK